MALARALDGVALRGLRVVELGCGLAVPSIAAARAGATVLATDACAYALTLVAQNARANDVHVETATVDWAKPDELLERAPFDLVLAADVLYERASVALLLSLLPRLAPEAWLADPGRPAAEVFVEQAAAGGRSRRASSTSSRSTGCSSAPGPAKRRGGRQVGAGRRFNSAPSGRAGVRTRGANRWFERREAPNASGKTPEPM